MNIIRYHIILYHAIMLLIQAVKVSANQVLVYVVANQTPPMKALRACVLV